MQLPLHRFSEKGEKRHIEVFADEHESGVPEVLASMNVVVRKTVLPVGDYILSERVVCERKTRDDFENSIMDGRLFHQAGRMLADFPRALVVIEGERFAERVGKSAVLGAIAALIVDYGVSVFFTRDEEKTAELLYAIARREQLGEKREVRLLGEKRAWSLAQRQQLIIETLPNVGPKLAKALLARFGSVEKVFKASEKQLQEVEKIGEKKAREIRRVITAKYERSEQEL
ncbi:MAG: ERCC4 domain-containing protein [Candidatus Micrarchaeia archaeon]